MFQVCQSKTVIAVLIAQCLISEFQVCKSRIVIVTYVLLSFILCQTLPVYESGQHKSAYIVNANLLRCTTLRTRRLMSSWRADCALRTNLYKIRPTNIKPWLADRFQPFVGNFRGALCWTWKTWDPGCRAWPLVNDRIYCRGHDRDLLVEEETCLSLPDPFLALAWRISVGVLRCPCQ